MPTPEELRYTSQLLEARSYTAHHKEVGMYYCGLDISMQSTHSYIEDARGRQVHRCAVATTPAGLIGALAPFR